jgi:pyruvate-formate lyase
VANDEGLDKLVPLVRTCFKLDGHHIQFNVVDAATLRTAQQNRSSTAVSLSAWLEADFLR